MSGPGARDEGLPGLKPAEMEVFPDEDALSEAAAALIAAQAMAAIRARGHFLWALAGGRTPARTYARLAKSPFREQIDWGKVEIFFGDERCVPPDDPLSNYRLAEEKLLSRVPLPAAQVHRLACEHNPEEEARRYEALLQRIFQGRAWGFDLALLGLGADGHTASLFPGLTPPAGAWVAAVARPGESFRRLTLTPEVLNLSRLVVFLVTGRDKAQTLRAVLTGEEAMAASPVHLLRPPAGEIRWLADQEAAALL
ncbi:MAG: 6-phosphogluconolactonase [Desulfobaccales bacterium]